MDEQHEQVTWIRGYWDDTHDNPGWFVECKNRFGEVVVDSMKVWFPVDVDSFGLNQKSELIAAIQDEFPCTQVVFE